jgi:hypothetical protein
MIHLDGLLHLSGIAAAISIAYVGLDRIHWEEEEFFANLTKVENKFSEAVHRFGIRMDQVTPKASFKLFPLFCLRLKLFALCHVARVKVKMGVIGRFCHWFHILRHAPLLPYFRARMERTTVRWMAVIAIAVFIVTAQVRIGRSRGPQGG